MDVYAGGSPAWGRGCSSLGPGWAVPGRGAALQPTPHGGGGQLVGYPDWCAAHQPGTDPTNGRAVAGGRGATASGATESFGVTPEDVARARLQRTTRDHWSLDAPSVTGGSGPSLQGVGGARTPGLLRAAVDPGYLRQLAQVFRDAAEEASTAASDGTPVPGRGAAVARALAAAQGPSPGPASAGVPAAPKTGSGTSGERPRKGGVAGMGPALTMAVSPAACLARPRSQRAAERRRPQAVPSTGHLRRRHARRAP